jgi:hypothetical protein
MGFSFDPGRDFFYLAFLLFGAALGLFLNSFRQKCNKGFQNRLIVIAILFLSGAIASLPVMLILTGGKFIADPAMFIIGVVFALLALLSIRFPRTVGFSFILLAGICIVWVSYAFSRFPRIESQSIALAYITGEQRGFSIEFVPEKQKVFLIPETHELELRVTRIEYAYFFPLVGGESRGRITSIRSNGTVMYEYPYFEKGLLRPWNSLFFISSEMVSMGFPIETLQPGRIYRISYDFETN